MTIVKAQPKPELITIPVTVDTVEANEASDDNEGNIDQEELSSNDYEDAHETIKMQFDEASYCSNRSTGRKSKAQRKMERDSAGKADSHHSHTQTSDHHENTKQLVD